MARLSSIKVKEFIKALIKDGYRWTHQSGSHATYRKDKDMRRVIVAIHSPGEDIPKGTLRRMIKDAGWTVDYFNKLRKS